MTMEEAWLNFASQFDYQPEIINADRLLVKKKTILAGMGGSHLAADLLKAYDPFFPILIHWDYGLPHLPKKNLDRYWLIASSYSGNTEETVDALRQGLAKNMAAAVITTGGELEKIAKAENLPYVKIPDWGLPPREALGLSLKGLLALLGQEKLMAEIKKLKHTLSPDIFQDTGRVLAQTLGQKTPIIYASRSNSALAYIWKVKFNETGKRPAFYNIFSELNHNEMAGFGGRPNNLNDDFQFLFITDEADDQRIKKRMAATEKVFKDLGFLVNPLPLTGRDRFERLFNSVILAGWTTYYIAQENGLDPQKTPVIEEFKKKIT